MLSYSVMPQPADIMSGHVPNTVTPVWFEQARTPLWQAVNQLSEAGTSFGIVRHASYDFQRELWPESKVEINTSIISVGQSSAVCQQEAWQSGQLAVVATVVLVLIDEKQRSKALLSAAANGYLQQLITVKPASAVQ